MVTALWDQTTAARSRGTLLVVMDATRRAWSGTERAKAFYAEQQRLWVELLAKTISPIPAPSKNCSSFFREQSWPTSSLGIAKWGNALSFE